MSAPVAERGRTAVRGRTAAIPAQRGAVAAPVAPTADPAAGGRRKAYAGRDERARRGAGVRPERTAAPAGRPQFVLLIMVLLAAGLVATLWLSTAAAADSYRLQDATADARVLSEQAERLKQDVAVLASAPELARRAGDLGMVPVRDPARLVVAADGGVEVVGQPRAAVAPPPPAPPAPPEGTQPPAADGATPEGTTPEGTTPEAGASPGDSARLAASDTEEAGTPAVDGDTPAEGARDDESGQGAADADTDGGEDTGQDAGRGTEARADGGATDAG
ncbi:hypothetical protein [Pseudonocardia sp. DLS-67]